MHPGEWGWYFTSIDCSGAIIRWMIRIPSNLRVTSRRGVSKRTWACQCRKDWIDISLIASDQKSGIDQEKVIPTAYRWTICIIVSTALSQRVHIFYAKTRKLEDSDFSRGASIAQTDLISSQRERCSLSSARMFRHKTGEPATIQVWFSKAGSGSFNFKASRCKIKVSHRISPQRLEPGPGSWTIDHHNKFPLPHSRT